MSNEQQTTEETQEPTPEALAVARERKDMSITTPMGRELGSVADGWYMAKILSDSELVPKDFQGKPANIFLALQMGAELGLAPMQAIQSICVINGRPSLWGDGLLGLCLPYLKFIEETDDGHEATCRVQRKGSTYVVVRTFSMDDALEAGLVDDKGRAARSRDGSGPWKSYPKRMRQMRARAFALRDTCADILRGVQSADEQQDLVTIAAETVVHTPKRIERAPEQASGTQQPTAPAPEEVTPPSDSEKQAPKRRPGRPRTRKVEPKVEPKAKTTDEPEAPQPDAEKPHHTMAEMREMLPGQDTDKTPEASPAVQDRTQLGTTPTSEVLISHNEREEIRAAARAAGMTFLAAKGLIAEKFGYNSTADIPVHRFEDVLDCISAKK